MPDKFLRSKFKLHILDQPDDLILVENLQRIVWPGDETEVVPSHLLLTAAHHGGLVIGAFLPQSLCNSESEKISNQLLKIDPQEDEPSYLIGFVFGFPGLDESTNDLQQVHCSHMLAVHPSFRSQGVGFKLKRAQWQMVRRQGIERITWTYDPLLSTNAQLNIAALGAVCQTYQPNLYGEMRDGLNAGLPSDRFVVDWWINSTRVQHRLSKNPRIPLDLAHFLAAQVIILNPTQIGGDGFPYPANNHQHIQDHVLANQDPILLVEIPSDFQKIKAHNPTLAQDWRLHTRALFEMLFGAGFLVTDFVHLRGKSARSFYVLCHGDQTL